MTLKAVPTYSDGKHTVTFVALDPTQGSRPSFTHRVIINRKSVGFLNKDHKPSLKSAEYFLSVYLETK